MKFYTHNSTSISVIVGKFHKNPLFRLRDFKFFQLLSQISVTKKYCQPFVQFLVTSPSSRTVPQPTVPARRLRYCHQCWRYWGRVPGYSPPPTPFYPPKINEIAYKLACMAHRPEVFGPTRGFSSPLQNFVLRFLI